jgi:hypothetical protein
MQIRFEIRVVVHALAETVSDHHDALTAGGCLQQRGGG